MKIIIIQGGGATGKSTLAKELEKAFDIPIFSKDSYRMARYNYEKTSFMGWRKLEAESYTATYDAIKIAISNSKSLIVEGNFHVTHRRDFQEATKGCPNIIEIDCYTKGFVAAKRYIVRNRKDAVNEGYRDYLRYMVVLFEAFCSMLGLGWYKSLNLTKNVIKLDTSDLKEINYKPVIDLVKSIN